MKWAHRSRYNVFFVLVACITLSGTELRGLARGRNPQSTNAAPPTQHAHVISPSVISESRLTPALRTKLKVLQFSPDGRYILLQDETTIYVLTRDPLSILFQVEAADAAPARFSPDSQQLVIPTYTMGVEWRSLPDGKVIQTTVLAPEGSCYEARLSSRADLYGCIDRSLTLRVFDIAKRQQVLVQKIDEVPPRYVAPEYPEGPDRVPLWDTGLQHWHILDTFLEFSPDNHFVVASSFRGKSIVASFATGGQLAMREPLSRALDNRTLKFVAPGRVLAQPEGETSMASVISFPDGSLVETLPLAGAATAASDPRYGLVTNPQTERSTVVDLQTAKEVQDLPVERADVLGDFIVGYDRTSDEIVLTKVGQSNPAAQMQLPVGFLSHMTGAAVSSDLKSIAIGVRGDGGVFQTAAGKRVAQLDSLRGAWFDRNERCYAHVRKSDGSDGLREVDMKTGNISTDSPAWFSAFDQKKTRLMFSGSIVVSDVVPGWGTWEPVPELSFPGEVMDRHRRARENVAFSSRDTSAIPGDGWKMVAFDIATGKALWNRKYNFGLSEWDVPYEGQARPFDDSQGTRFVLGWIANTNHARDAARRASQPSRCK